MTITKIFYILYQKDFPKVVTSVASQGLLSISNFLIGILMVKYAAKSDYGLYVIFFSIIYAVRAFHGGLICSPFQVLVNHKNEDQRKIYIGSLSGSNLYLSVPLVAILMLAGSAYIVINNFSNILILEILVLSVVIVVFVFKEFIRTLHFAEMRANTIFKMDFINAVVAIAGILLLGYFEIVTDFTALIVLGAGYLAAYMVGKWTVKIHSILTMNEVFGALKENWNYGKWATLGVTCSMLQDRGYIYLTSILLSLGDLADISAARLFLMPIGLLNTSSAKIVIAKGAKLISQGNNLEFRKFTFSFISLLLIGWVLCFVTIQFAMNFIIGFLGEKYVGINNLIILWGIFYGINIIRYQLQTALIVYRKFKELSLYDIWGAVVVVGFCLLLVSFIGSSGAIISVILGETLTMFLYLRLYWKTVKAVDQSFISYLK